MTYWKESFLIGVPQIDAQHRQLFKAMDNLMEACMQGKGRTEIEKTLDFALKYTVEHFRDEEKIQAAHAYPGLNAHKKLHADFTVTVTDLAKEFNKSGPSVALTGKLNKSLVDWVITHVSTEDKKVGEHIKKVTKG